MKLAPISTIIRVITDLRVFDSIELEIITLRAAGTYNLIITPCKYIFFVPAAGKNSLVIEYYTM